MKRVPAGIAAAGGLALGIAAAAGVVRIPRGPDPVPMPDLVAIQMSEDTPLWVQRYEVTVAEWNLCHEKGGCSRALTAPGGRPPQETPATTLSQPDTAEYVAWTGARTGYPFRLPTAAEWSEMAQDVLSEPSEPLFQGPGLGWASAYLVDEARPRGIRLRGAFSVTTDGVADLDGSVWEWTQDCVPPAHADRCPAYVVGGEHMAVIPYLERDPARGGCAVGTPPAHLGMRLVSDRAPGSA